MSWTTRLVPCARWSQTFGTDHKNPLPDEESSLGGLPFPRAIGYTHGLKRT